MRERLRADLKSAIKSRDRPAVNLLRTTLAAIDNAEAIDGGGDGSRVSESEHVAGAAAGAYSTDVPRRALSAGEIATILREQAEEREQAAADYQRRGRDEEARHLLHEADLLRKYLT